MGKNTTLTTQSLLSGFPVNYEFNETWSQAKKAIKVRTHKE